MTLRFVLTAWGPAFITRKEPKRASNGVSIRSSVEPASERGKQKDVAQDFYAVGRERRAPLLLPQGAEGGHVFSVYVGGGIAGTLASQLDEAERKDRGCDREELRRELAHQDRVDALVERSWRVAEAAAKSALEEAGFHLHNRQWRLKRNGEA